jgi:hypothetical protein
MSKEEHGMIWIFSATLQNWEEKEIVYQIKQYALIENLLTWIAFSTAHIWNLKINVY